MTTAVVAPMPKDQLDLIKRTVANGATNDELALFLYDCERRGIHPLDKLLHFTKRGGKYTPVTSIDFMRSQAAASGEMAGSDDPTFYEEENHPGHATVTVYRMTQGQRFAYTATARWSEYCPDNAPMWKRMPHTMLGKCAEALALRKAFPQQLAGLYAKEEMDQADEPQGFSVSAPPAATSVAPVDSEGVPPARSGGDSGHPSATVGSAYIDDGQLRIRRVDILPTRNANIQKATLVMSTGETFSTIKERMIALAVALAQEGCPVVVEGKTTRYGLDLVSLNRAVDAPVLVEPQPSAQPLTSDEIPF